MEASLVTVYVLALRLNILNSRRVSSIRRRFLDAVRGSLHDMFLGAVVLSLGVLIAAALGRNQTSSNPVSASDCSVENESSPYAVDGPLRNASNSVLLLVTTFCVNPVLLLYILLGRGYRRRWLTRAITFISWLIWVLSQTLRVFTSDSWRSRRGFTPDATIGELIQWDDRSHSYPGCTYGLQAGRGTPFLLWICFWVTLILPALYSVYILVTSVMALSGLGVKYGGTLRRPRWRVFERTISATTMFFSFVGMWDSLGILLYIHKHTGGISWDLGQVLALGTWIPVLFEFTYVLICKFDLTLTTRNDTVTYIWLVGIPSILEIRMPPEQIRAKETESMRIYSAQDEETKQMTVESSDAWSSSGSSTWTRSTPTLVSASSIPCRRET